MVKSISMRPKTQQIFSRVDQNAQLTLEKAETQKQVDIASGKSIPPLNFDELLIAHANDGETNLSFDEPEKAFNSSIDRIQSAQQPMLSIGLMYGSHGLVNNGMIPSTKMIPNPIDQNSDGSIDKSEMQALVDKIAERSGQTISVDDLFSQYDADQDEVLNADEAKQALSSIIKEVRPASYQTVKESNSSSINVVA
jgi:uncharacterized protein YqfB (UPF0267 family)